jgi:hypothetical protein
VGISYLCSSRRCADEQSHEHFRRGHGLWITIFEPSLMSLTLFSFICCFFSFMASQAQKLQAIPSRKFRSSPALNSNGDVQTTAKRNEGFRNAPEGPPKASNEKWPGSLTAGTTSLNSKREVAQRRNQLANTHRLGFEAGLLKPSTCETHRIGRGKRERKSFQGSLTNSVSYVIHCPS